MTDPLTAHSFSPVILREYDIRGEVGKTLFEADALALGRKFGLMLRRSGNNTSDRRTICVGRDGRLTSPMLAAALIEGLLGAGVHVTDLGVGPTPLAYYGLKKLGVDAAIMVTGSHNPAPDNGFKMALQHRPFFGADIQELARAMPGLESSGNRGELAALDLTGAYVDRLLQDYEIPGGNRDRPLKIVWDAGNGATGAVLHRLVRGITADHTILNGTIDGRFPAHHPDPTVPENLKQLIEAVNVRKADVGIAFDGDGDRIGVVDGKGRIVWGDQLLLLLAREVVTHNPGATVIADVKSSQVLFDEVGRLGGNILMARTGHSLIKTKIIETGALLAGEMSGHIFFADKYYGYDDALYSAIRFINILQKGEVPLSQMIDALPHFHNTPEIRIDCPDDRKFKVVDDICRQLRAEGATVSTIDGVRVSRPGGWWLLRASNTQSSLVARCEASNVENLEMLKKELTFYLASRGISL